VIGLTKAAALEYGPQHIRANAICPGFIHTEGMAAGIPDMWGDLEPKVPLRRYGSAIEVAELGAFLSSDRASYINGAAIPIDGGYGCHLP
jgi:NAD(P)-dependent dehydrogenase (short-subunit alcohol dehydrogenase family)